MSEREEITGGMREVALKRGKGKTEMGTEEGKDVSSEGEYRVAERRGNILLRWKECFRVEKEVL